MNEVKFEIYNRLVEQMDYLISSEQPFKENNRKIKLLREVVNFHLKYNEFYKVITDVVPIEGDLENIREPADIPPLPTNVFKKSIGKYEDFVTVKELPFHYYASSATSGDPSLVGRTDDDKRIMQSVYITGMLDFLGEGGFGETHFSLSIPPDLVPSDTKVKLQTLEIFKAVEELTSVKYYVEPTSKGVIPRYESLIDDLNKYKKEKIPASMGGSVILLNEFFSKLIKRQIEFDFGSSFKLAFGGGGWDGVKGRIKGSYIEKETFIKNAIDILGIFPENIMDGFATSEISVFFPGHWSEEHRDFLYHTPVAYGDILIRDPETYNIIEGEGSVGLLNIIGPLAPTTAGTNSLVVDDVVELVSADKCDECSRKGAVFKYIERARESHKTGCGAMVLKYLKEV